MKRLSASVIGLVALAAVWLIASAQVSIFGNPTLQGNQTFTGMNSFTGPMLLSAGTAAVPSLALIGTPTTGFYFPSTTNIYVKGTGFGVGSYGTGAVFLTGTVAGGGTVQVGSIGNYSFANSTNEQGTQDTNISRSAAGVLAVGTGAQGSTAGTVATTKFQFTSFIFANIATVLTTNGQMGYCSDCTVTVIATCPGTQASCTCAGSGNGAIARFLNSVAYCTP